MFRHRFVRLSCICMVTVILVSALVMPSAYADTGSGPDSFDLSAYEGKKVALEAGSIYADNYSDYFNNVEPCFYPSSSDCLVAVSTGKADVFLGDSLVIEYSASKIDGLEVMEIGEANDNIAILAAKKEDGSVNKYLTEFNEYLRSLKESGEYDKVVYRWFEGPEDEIEPLGYDSLPAPNGVVTIATNAAYAPFEYTIDGEITGFEIELVAGFCREYGYGLEIVTCSFESIIPGITLGKYDLGVSGFSVTEERKKSVDFSDVIITNAPAICFMGAESANTSGFLSNMASRFRVTFIEEGRWQMFVSGAMVTLAISVLSIIFGLILGMAVHLICRGKNKLANRISAVTRWLVKGLPEVVFLMILFYIIFGKSSISGEWVAIIAFSILFACSVHEMMMASEAALDPGQALAAEALGYTKFQSYFHITLPQALQFFLPSFMTAVTAHIKATAIVGYIAVIDLTKASDLVRGTTYEAVFPLVGIAVIYFLLAGILRLLIRLVIRKTNPRTHTESSILKGVDVK